MSLHVLRSDRLYTFPFSSEADLLKAYYLVRQSLVDSMCLKGLQGALTPDVIPRRYMESVKALLKEWERFQKQTAVRHLLVVNTSKWMIGLGGDALTEICQEYNFKKGKPFVLGCPSQTSFQCFQSFC